MIPKASPFINKILVNGCNDVVLTLEMRANIIVRSKLVQSAFSALFASYWKKGNLLLIQSQTGH